MKLKAQTNYKQTKQGYKIEKYIHIAACIYSATGIE
jgi:hypothetical protein